MPDPLVSVLIPAYRAEATLPAALRSVAASGLPDGAVEIVVAPDDGQEYGRLLPQTPGLRCLPPGPVASGPGATRNRARAAARGAWHAFLDADDTWAPGYLAALLPLAQAHGVAFGRTRILRGTAPALDLPGTDRTEITLETFGTTGASFHPVMAAALSRPFPDLPAQDVAHAVDLLARLGGSAPLGEASYELHLRGDSTTAQEDFSARVAAAYAAYERAFEAADLPPQMAYRAAQVFRDKAALNAAYTAEGQGRAFYDFVADRLARSG
ncbi:glycosyltransferase family 2 protein [Pseudooceanicola nanhaiensis]|uniref:glycosyltransferase family 2 protein n=1 Tax=Pseudooceanicola nanhaiensis TaxID=375761 RepID=UPI001CD760D6|nr:glycosyltransferase family 2 protein [Pseudooceanicola nanhaiensis]MCA0919115.1 glycosyltransferase family 2 protein [Pseudooceanicola nanhaiensis]